MPQPTKLVKAMVEPFLEGMRAGCTYADALKYVPEELRPTERLIQLWMKNGREDLELFKATHYAVFAAHVDEILNARRTRDYYPNEREDTDRQAPRTKEVLIDILWRAANAGSVSATNTLLRYLGGITDAADAGEDPVKNRAARDSLDELDKYASIRELRNAA